MIKFEPDWVLVVLLMGLMIWDAYDNVIMVPFHSSSPYPSSKSINCGSKRTQYPAGVHC